MYYLLSFKLLRRKHGGRDVLQYKAKFDTEFIGFSEFLKSLPEDKKISVRIYINKRKIMINF
jgi:hypothetical protein